MIYLKLVFHQWTILINCIGSTIRYPIFSCFLLIIIILSHILHLSHISQAQLVTSQLIILEASKPVELRHESTPSQDRVLSKMSRLRLHQVSGPIEWRYFFGKDVYKLERNGGTSEEILQDPAGSQKVCV